MASRQAPKARSPRSKAATPGVWARQTEAQSLQLPADLLREARANSRRVAGDVVFLARLAREIAVTRGPELTLAYRSLVWVLPGFRTKRTKRRQPHPSTAEADMPVPGPSARLTQTLCIVFVVRRKRDDLAADAQQRLPRWLVTYAEHDGIRQPFAIPTDVQDASTFNRVTAHTAGAVWTQRSGWVEAPGHLTALVRLHHAGGQQHCLLGAQHVFTPFVDGSTLRIEAGLPVYPLASDGTPMHAPRLATSMAVGGLLRDDENPQRPSFDVQLAEVDALADAAVRQRIALRNIDPAQPWVPDFDTVLVLSAQNSIALLSPDNHPKSPGRGAIAMRLAIMPNAPVAIPYQQRSGDGTAWRRVFHAELLCFQATTPGKGPFPGDSGSPVVARLSDGRLRLVGMHIGGDGLGKSWVIPAWLLFKFKDENRDIWAQYPDGASLSLVEP